MTPLYLPTGPKTPPEAAPAKSPDGSDLSSLDAVSPASETTLEPDILRDEPSETAELASDLPTSRNSPQQASETRKRDLQDHLGSQPGADDFEDASSEEEFSDIEINVSTERDRLRLLVPNFDDQQMARYEVYRRANIGRSGVKRLANAVLNQSITGSVAIALSGIAKVFVGEVIEKSLEVKNRRERKERRLKIAEELPAKRRKLEKERDELLEQLKEKETQKDILGEQEDPRLRREEALDVEVPGESEKDTEESIRRKYDEELEKLEETAEKILQTGEDPQEDSAASAAASAAPLRPEDVREAWREYLLENDTVPAAQWRLQGGEGSGLMFR